MAALFIYLLAIILLFIFYISILRSVLWSDAPFVPTGRRDMRRILELANIKPGEVVYDLGSGDGRLVRAAARLGARAIGIERLWILVFWSRLVWRITNLHCHALGDPVRGNGGAAIFKAMNFHKQNISDADVVFCYLLPKAMAGLKEKFERELRPGTRVISRAFKIPGWIFKERYQFRKHAPPVYLYVK